VIVVDASALVESLLRLPAAEAVDERLFRVGEALHVPHLVDIEIVHALRRRLAAGQIEPARCGEVLEDLSRLRLFRHPHGDLIPRVWELRNNLTAYDAIYVALAELLDAPLLTRDRRIAAAPGHRAQVDLV